MKYKADRIQLVSLVFRKDDVVLPGASIAAQLKAGERYVVGWYQAKLPTSEASIQEGSYPSGSAAAQPLNDLRMAGFAGTMAGSQAHGAFYDDKLTVPADRSYVISNFFNPNQFNNISPLQDIHLNMIVRVFRPAGAFDEGYV